MPVHPFLRLSGASKRFGGVVALDTVDWEVMPGEVHCLVGENGSGKSTLIKLVSGVHWPDPGTEIEVDGKPHAGITPALAKALGIPAITGLGTHIDQLVNGMQVIIDGNSGEIILEPDQETLAIYKRRREEQLQNQQIAPADTPARTTPASQASRSPGVQFRCLFQCSC